VVVYPFNFLTKFRNIQDLIEKLKDKTWN